ncbi:hypothetical protein U9M48_032951 [Paspalum notatum var. saurae]|uniref:MINDY deubiquitinase domain-containing protein n=1 Tax=Paspalum notatum var. saurae TaxID=547442 RepID=A0AAQ3UAB7_PASNO
MRQATRSAAASVVRRSDIASRPPRSAAASSSSTFGHETFPVLHAPPRCLHHHLRLRRSDPIAYHHHNPYLLVPRVCRSGFSDQRKMYSLVKRQKHDTDVHILCNVTSPCSFDCSKTKCSCALTAVYNYLELKSPVFEKLVPKPKPDERSGHSVAEQVLTNFMCRRLFDHYQDLKSVHGDIVDPKLKSQIESEMEEVKIAIKAVPLLQSGLSLDPHFIRRDRFQFTRDNNYILLQYLGIRVLHGWLVDPQNNACYTEIGESSSNGLIKMMSELSSERERVKYQAVKNFLDSSEIQFTEYGFHCLWKELCEGDLGILYKNGHYRVITKHFGSLFILENNIDVLTHHVGAMWRTLEDEVYGSSDHLYLTWEFKGKKWSLDANFEKLVNKIEGKSDKEIKDDEPNSKETKESETEIEKDEGERSDAEKKGNEQLGAAHNRGEESNEAVDDEYQIKQGNEEDQDTSCQNDELKMMIVSGFINFLENFKGSSTKPYFEGIMKMLEFLHIYDVHIPYVLIEAFNSELAVRVQDNYSWIHESLRLSVATYLMDHDFHKAVHVDEKTVIESVKLHIDSPHFPSSGSKQTFLEFVSQNKMLEEYAFDGKIFDNMSHAARNMSNGYLHNILDKFEAGYCWGGNWDESNLETKGDGSEFLINKPAEESLSKELAILDLEQFITCVLKKPFKLKKGLLAFFDDFQYDVQQMPDPITEKEKWRRFVKLMRCHYAFKHPLENGVQKVEDITIVELIILQHLERFIAHLFRFLVYDDVIDWMSSSPWRLYEESECIDRPLVAKEIMYDKVSKLYEELCNTISQEETLSENLEEKKLIEENIAWAHAEVGVLSMSSSSSITITSDVSFDKMAEAISASGTSVTVLGTNYLVCGEHNVSVYKMEDAKDKISPGSITIEGPICNDYTIILEVVSTLSSPQILDNHKL